MSETNGFSSATGKAEFVCAADDIKGVLQMLTRQIADADQRNGAILQDMRSRLDDLGREAESASARASGHYTPAFERIREGVAHLASRFASAGRERQQDKVTAESASAQAVHVASPVVPSSGPDVSPAQRAPAASNPPAVSAVQPSTVLADPADPWDKQAAEALVRLYDTGEAHVGRSVARIEAEATQSPSGQFVVSEPPAMASDNAVSAGGPDRAWLEARFAAIAERVEQSLADARPDSSFVALDSRLDQLEQRFAMALDDVATRADVEGLRIVEAHINELAAQFEKTQSQLGRLDGIEQQLGDVLTQVSDERFAELFNQVNQPAPAAELTDRHIATVADAVSDRIAVQMSAIQQSIQPVGNADVGAGVDELRLLVENFVADQRDGTDHTSSMLDTMQQAMIRLLDRMDAMENVGPAQASAMHAAPMREVAHAAAGYQVPTEVAPAFAAAEVPQVQLQAAPRHEQLSVPLPPNAHPHDASPIQYRAPDAGSGSTKQDFVAAARRAARAAASQKAIDELVVEAAPGVAGRPAAALQSTPVAAAGRSRMPLMVAGVALVAAVGILAASVGMNRGQPFKASAKVSDVERAVINSKATALTLEDDTAGTATGAAPSSEINGTSGSEGSADVVPALQQEAQLPGQGTARVSLASADGMPLGISVMQPSTQPTPQAIARAQQQRHMATLSGQLGAAQPAHAAVPAALMPDASRADGGSLAAGQGRTVNEMPPAGIGPASLRSAAANGDPSAEFEIAARFAEGRGIAQDFKQAMVWYQRSAQRGFAPAQYRLGTLYERGIGTKSDVARAKVWYGRAAEQGNVKAMHNLAVLSAGRDQSAPDYAIAVQWFTTAANLGLADSQFNLGVLHESGLGLPRDFKQAYHWLSLAARAGDKEAARRRDTVRMKLDEAEANKIDAVVASWQAQPVQMIVNDARAAGDAWKRRQSVGQSG